MSGHGGGRLAGHLAEDEAGLVVLLQVGDVLHHAALLVGHGEGVGAVGEQVEVPQDEYHGDGQDSHDNERDQDGHGPVGEIQVALGSLGAHTGEPCCLPCSAAASPSQTPPDHSHPSPTSQALAELGSSGADPRVRWSPWLRAEAPQISVSTLV